MLIVIYADCHYAEYCCAECYYTDCHNAQFRYTEFHGAIIFTPPSVTKKKCL